MLPAVAGAVLVLEVQRQKGEETILRVIQEVISEFGIAQMAPTWLPGAGNEGA